MKLLLIVAHPDDEILGAGATIQKFIRRGDSVAVFTLGMSSATRETDLWEKQKASHKLAGISHRYCGELEAMKFQDGDRYRTVRAIEAAIKAERPDWVITHFPNDLHNDHKITATLAQEAIRLPQRQTGYSRPITKVLYMEVATATDWGMEQPFHPNFFVEVGKNDLLKKADTLTPYDNVMRKPPHPRNIETIIAQARVRGAQAGVMYAEAFEIAMEVYE